MASALADDLLLSAEELAWIANHPTIRVHNEMDWPPFKFNVDGKPTGFYIDYMNLVASRVGLNVEYISGCPSHLTVSKHFAGNVPENTVCGSMISRGSASTGTRAMSSTWRSSITTD